MNENLSPRLFDPGPPEQGPRISELEKFQAPVPKYMQTLQRTPNPIYTDEAKGPFHTMRRALDPVSREEFVPSYELTSPQNIVNPYAINHMVENASGVDVPDISVVKQGGQSVVYDGNHRVNAALERGQMLVPARVFAFPPR